jgi:hypothetical protein
MAHHEVDWLWVNGHAGIPGNNAPTSSPTGVSPRPDALASGSVRPEPLPAPGKPHAKQRTPHSGAVRANRQLHGATRGSPCVPDESPVRSRGGPQGSEGCRRRRWGAEEIVDVELEGADRKALVLLRVKCHAAAGLA